MKDTLKDTNTAVDCKFPLDLKLKSINTLQYSTRLNWYLVYPTIAEKDAEIKI